MHKVKFSFQEGGRIQSVEDFLCALRRFAGKGDFRIFFRGQNQPTAGLVPSVGRKHYYLGRSILFHRQAEKNLLVQFRRYAYEHFGRIATEWETLFLARHHGLPTRLLDWTSNPLVALYFAAFYENEQPAPRRPDPRASQKLDLNGTLWAFQRRSRIRELDIFTERRSPLRIPGIKMVYPVNPTPRMTAQSGVFTLHGDPWTDVVQCAGRAYSPTDLDMAKLIRWTVESRCKSGIILDLERLAVNSRTLFPDLEGLARGLWQTELIRKCFLEGSRDGIASSPRSLAE